MSPTSGEIRLEGDRIDGRRPHEVCRRGLARTFQIVKPFRGMTVVENVKVAALLAPSYRQGSGGGSAGRDRADRHAGRGRRRCRRIDRRPAAPARDCPGSRHPTETVAAGRDARRPDRNRGRRHVRPHSRTPQGRNRGDRRRAFDSRDQQPLSSRGSSHFGKVLLQGPTRDVIADPRTQEAYLGTALS